MPMAVQGGKRGSGNLVVAVMGGPSGQAQACGQKEGSGKAGQ